MLHARSWRLVVAPEHEYYVFSDEPVSLVSIVKLSPLYGPGFGMRHTEVTMPISKSVMLLGRFEDKPGVFQTNRQGVAVLNSRTGMYAPRWVFSPHQDFCFYTRDGKVGNVTDLVRAIKETREKQIPEM